MWWLVLAILAAIAAALCTFSDNYITDTFFKGREPQAQKAFFGPAYLITAVLMLILLQIQAVPVWVAIGLIIAGAISSLSLIPYYSALSEDDSTEVTIFEQLSPIFYLIFGRLFLGDDISGGQLAGFVVVMIAPLIIILSSRKRSKKAKLRTAGLILIKVATIALANTLIVKFGGDYELTTIFFYVIIGKGLIDTILAFSIKKWRVRYKNVHKKNRGVKFFSVMLADHIAWLAGDFLVYASLALAPTVAMASAVTKTLHPIFVFTFGIVLTLLWPAFGREKLNKKTILTNLIATAVAVVGIVLMQVL